MSTCKYLALLLLALMLTSVNSTFAQAYEWGIKPGTAEWKTIQTHQEMLKVLQIPDEVLENMKLEDLVVTCLNYPLFLDMWAFNSLQDGIDVGINNFNGFQKLLKQQGTGKELLNKYREIDPSFIDIKKTAISRGEFKMSLCKIEVLLSQKEILLNMSKSDRENLLEEVSNKNKTILSNKEYSFISIESNLFLISRILAIDNSEAIELRKSTNKQLENFINTGSRASNQTVDDICKIVSKDNSGNEIYSDTPISFYTPRGSLVPRLS